MKPEAAGALFAAALMGGCAHAGPLSNVAEQTGLYYEDAKGCNLMTLADEARERLTNARPGYADKKWRLAFFEKDGRLLFWFPDLSPTGRLSEDTPELSLGGSPPNSTRRPVGS